MSPTSKDLMAFVDISWRGNAVRIEHEWINAQLNQAPLFVFLHEGLGSVAMWRDYPQVFCDALQVRGLVYSRPGYGHSTPRALEEAWQSDFMHQQAHVVLPALLSALNIQQAPWLFGHSDGGSIALLFASHQATAGVIVLAPHIHVENICIKSIQEAKVAYENTNLRQKLSRYHANVDSAFWGWSNIWLDPDFATWSIESDLSLITCPLLAIQGVNDEYGTLEQIRGIRDHVPQTELLELNDCAHSPHRDQPQALTQACLNFFSRHHNPLT